MFLVHSTRNLTTTQVKEAYENLNRFLAELGIHEPFPSIEEIALKQQLEKENGKH